MSTETAKLKMDDFEAIDTFRQQDDRASLERHLGERGPNLVGKLFQKLDDPDQLQRDVACLGGRFCETTLTEADMYALLELSEQPGLGEIHGLVEEAAYRDASHPNRIPALRALDRRGERAAATILRDINTKEATQRRAVGNVVDMRPQDPRIGII